MRWHDFTDIIHPEPLTEDEIKARLTDADYMLRLQNIIFKMCSAPSDLSALEYSEARDGTLNDAYDFARFFDSAHHLLIIQWVIGDAAEDAKWRKEIQNKEREADEAEKADLRNKVAASRLEVRKLKKGGGRT